MSIILEGASKPKAPKEDKNTLKSVSKGHIVDLLAYGPVKGLVNGLTSVLIDDTPIMNEDGTTNFDGISVDMRYGDPDQDVIPGFRDVASPKEINTEVLFDQPPVRSTTNTDIDAVVITVSIPALVKTDDKGNQKEAEVSFHIDIQTSGQWVTEVSDTVIGKNTSPYEKSYRINLKGEGPYLVRVRREKKESDEGKLRDAVFWHMMTEVVDVRHSYPNCVLAGISVDSSLFGSSIPSRKYLMDLSIVKVPSNYDPETRTYTGFWDGQFKEAWTDNPAWCYYDLATHPVIGAGIENVNKWALYEIGRYCDEYVDDGYGGTEPRFTCNTILSSAEDAITALGSLATVFRGMNYWGSNTLEPVADMPGPVRKVITPAEVIDGEFSYVGTSLRDRHSVAIVSWNDPEDGYESKPEMVEDPESIELLGWRELKIVAVACSSRGQARRLGMWALYSEREETQTLSFKVPVKHADFRPGDFFEVQDPYRAGARLGGRTLAVNGRDVTLDAVPVEVTPGWTITLETEEGGLTQETVSRVTGSVVRLIRDRSSVLKKGGAFALSSSAISSQIFRVLAVHEEEEAIYTVTATSHDPRKYDHIEKGLDLPDIPVSFIPTGRIAAPRNITAEEYKYLEGGADHQGITVSWSAPQDSRATYYVLEVKSPEDLSFRTAYSGAAVSHDITYAFAGTWYFRVRVQSEEWGQSAWTETSFQIANLLMPSPPTYLELSSSSFTINVVPITQNNVAYDFEFYRSEEPLLLPLVESNATYVATGSFLVDTPLPFDTLFYYYVRGVNAYGKSEFVSGNIKTKADIDEILEAALKEHQESEIGKFFKGEIDKISGRGPGSVNERVDGVDLKADATLAEIDRISDSLRVQLEDLENQLALFSGAEEWQPAKPYLQNNIVNWQGGLFSALKDVPEDIEPGTALDDSDYWLRIGDFETLSEGISDLAIRVNTAETTVAEIGGIVTPMSTQLNSMGAMWRDEDEGDEALLGALENWDSRAAFSEEVRVRANEVEALSERLTNFNTSIGDLSSSITTLEQSFTTETEALAKAVTALEAEVEGNVKASIVAEREARVTEQRALASAIDAMSVSFGQELSAAIQLERRISADANEARAQEINTVQASVGNVNASVQQVSNAVASIDGSLRANWGVKVQVDRYGNNPVIAGVGLEVDNSEANPTSAFTVKADTFRVVQSAGGLETIPFAIDPKGRTVIRGALIQDASISNAKIGNTIQSDDFVAGSKGWRIDKKNGAEFHEAIIRGPLYAEDIRGGINKLYPVALPLNVRVLGGTHTEFKRVFLAEGTFSLPYRASGYTPYFNVSLHSDSSHRGVEGLVVWVDAFSEGTFLGTFRGSGLSYGLTGDVVVMGTSSTKITSSLTLKLYGGSYNHPSVFLNVTGIVGGLA